MPTWPPAKTKRWLRDAAPSFRTRHHLQFSNVKYGLIRFDRDTRRVPLSWPTLDTTQPFPSLSLVTAESKNPFITTRPRLKRILADVENMHIESAANPFARLLPAGTIDSFAIKALCGSTSNATTDWRNCSTEADDSNQLSGTIVMIGDHSAADKHDSVLGPMYGVDLHANYVAALLSDQIYTPVGDRISNAMGAAVWFALIQAILFFKNPLRNAGLICIALWAVMFGVSFVFSL